MNDDKNNERQSRTSINRRRFVQSLGAVGGASAFGTFGMSRVSASEPETADAADVKRALSAEKTRNVLEEIGDPAVQRGRARTVGVTTEWRDIEAVLLPTPVGDVVYAEADDGVTEAFVDFGTSRGNQTEGVPKGLRKQLPEKYAALPAETDVVHLSAENGTTTFREATSAERARLAEATGVDEGTMRAAFADAKRDAFHVISHTDDNTDMFRVSTGDADVSATSDAAGAGVAYREVTSDEFDAANVEHVATTRDDGDVSTDATFEECLGICGTCVTGTYKCGSCIVTCAGGVTGIGIIACAVCLSVLCGASGGMCGYCYNECNHFV